MFYLKGVWKVGGIYDVFQLANQKGRLIFFKLVYHVATLLLKVQFVLLKSGFRY